MGLFNKNQANTVQSSQQQVLENSVRSARNNILIVLAFTIINIVLLISNGNTYFLFSAYVPYMLVDYGMFFGGMYPDEYYGEYLYDIEFLGKEFFGMMISLAVVALVLYILCWVFAKKNPKGWLTFALVLICIDTALLIFLAGISMDLIMDYLFHGWIIVSFITGLSAIKKLKNLQDGLVERDFVDAEIIREEEEALSIEE